MAFTHYRTQGIFLQKEDRGESDQVLTIFTHNFGKLEVLARAVRKITSKLRPAADLFLLSEIEFVQGKAHKTLTDAILIDRFKNLRENPARLDLAFQIANVFDCLIGSEERDKKLWQLLNETFQALNNNRLPLINSDHLSLINTGHLSLINTGHLSLINSNHLSLIGNNYSLHIYYYFLWRLFSLLGYKPELYSCSVCQRKLLPETFYFLAEEGGMVCWQCLGKLAKDVKKKSREIGVDTVKVLRIFLKDGWDILPKLRIDDKTLENLGHISEQYLCFLQESIRGCNSGEF